MIRITDGAVQPFEKEHVERVRAEAAQEGPSREVQAPATSM